jgi:hypothetical protein
VTAARCRRAFIRSSLFSFDVAFLEDVPFLIFLATGKSPNFSQFEQRHDEGIFWWGRLVDGFSASDSDENCRKLQVPFDEQDRARPLRSLKRLRIL